MFLREAEPHVAVRAARVREDPWRLSVPEPTDGDGDTRRA